jgi:predicted membrane-bound mannosyltransferase
VGSVAATAVGAVYTDPASEENELVQYVQPEPEMRATLETMHAADEKPGNPDVLFYGETYGEDNWHSRLPLPWYVEQWDAETVVAANQSELEAKRDGEWDGEIPAVIVTHPSDESSVEPYLDGYERHERYMATHTKKVVVYVDAER